MSLKFTQLKPTTLGLDYILDFGRHFGYTVSEVLKDRPEYIQWLVTEGKKFYPSVHNELMKIACKPTKLKGSYYKHLDAWYVHSDQDDWWEDVPF